MATLVLGVAGAAIGGSIDGATLGVSAATIGGFIGSSIGSVVDSWIISSLAPTQRIEGARLDTLRITASTKGPCTGPAADAGAPPAGRAYEAGAREGARDGAGPADIRFSGSLAAALVRPGPLDGLGAFAQQRAQGPVRLARPGEAVVLRVPARVGLAPACRLGVLGRVLRLVCFSGPVSGCPGLLRHVIAPGVGMFPQETARRPLPNRPAARAPRKARRRRASPECEREFAPRSATLSEYTAGEGSPSGGIRLK